MATKRTDAQRKRDLDALVLAFEAEPDPKRRRSIRRSIRRTLATLGDDKPTIDRFVRGLQGGRPSL